MMNTSTSRKVPVLKRLLGISLMIFSALGLIISLLALPAVHRVSIQVTESADKAVETALAALDTTSQTLALVHGALGETKNALGAIETVADGVQGGLQNTGEVVRSSSETLTGELSEVILDAQESLAAAEKGVAVVENMLHGLNAISRLTGLSYDPDVSLAESFASMNENLDTVPQTLADVGERLGGVKGSLGEIEAGFAELTGILKDTESILKGIQTSVEDYDRLVQDLLLALGDLRESLAGWIRAATYVLYFLLIWLAISMVGLFWQGWEMVRYHPVQLEDRVAELEMKIGKLED